MLMTGPRNLAIDVGFIDCRDVGDSLCLVVKKFCRQFRTDMICLDPDFEIFVRTPVNHILYFLKNFYLWFSIPDFECSTLDVYYFGGVQRSVGYMDM